MILVRYEGRVGAAYGLLQGEIVYEIRVIGLLDRSWLDWFDGFTISYEDNITVFVGAVPDQAALFGLLTKLNNLGLSISLVRKQEQNDGKAT